MKTKEDFTIHTTAAGKKVWLKWQSPTGPIIFGPQAEATKMDHLNAIIHCDELNKKGLQYFAEYAPKPSTPNKQP